MASGLGVFLLLAALILTVVISGVVAFGLQQVPQIEEYPHSFAISFIIIVLFLTVAQLTVGVVTPILNILLF